MTTVNEVRATFLKFFEDKGHVIVPSSSLVPMNDPTLMFTNAGMVQFKNYFTGAEKSPYPRAVTSQKCVRAGGKHNDLDNVGYTARHHTFFEMLGNFSFGDYFKEKAISHAWELLTKVYGISPEKLLVTVYHDDDEAYDLWRSIAGLPEERIIRIATKDNFWAMGDTGPCGPCSEIFYDHGDHIAGGPPGSPNEDGDRFVEIWNLVFMQYEQINADERVSLPKPSIDTGMGLERIAAVLQGTNVNYEIDTFKKIIAASEQVLGHAASGDNLIAYKVIADHLRATSFLIADGVLPSNEGRGYVLRRIMRRAMRYAHVMGVSEPLIYKLVPTLVDEMGQAFPELGRAQALISETLKLEETRFKQTLERGLHLLANEVKKLGSGATLTGDVAFKLYDTYGFPYDLTEDALRRDGYGIDKKGFDAAMEQQKAKARASWAGSGSVATDNIWFDIREKSGATEFLGYNGTVAEGQVVAIVVNGTPVDEAKKGDAVAIIANQTPFYGESGGQQGDEGIIKTFNGAEVEVTRTTKVMGDMHIHNGVVKGGVVKIGDDASFEVTKALRAHLKANHSATHLMHKALRDVLGEHVTQKGSLVAPNYLRFDFSHHKPVTSEELSQVNVIVNKMIADNNEVSTRLMTPDEAIEEGAMALFGEKYGEEVRVVSMGERRDHSAFSVELCGGTHVENLGEIAAFKITGESSVASGIRRITAVTGDAVGEYEKGAKLAKIEQEKADKRKEQAKEQAKLKRKQALAAASVDDFTPENLNGISFVGAVLDGVEPKDMRSLADKAKKKLGSGVVVFVSKLEDKASLLVVVSDDVISRISAVDLVQVGSAVLGGKGGGRPDMAQAGGNDYEKVEDALNNIRKYIESLA
jgi:alanyl-tRNA synthetase